MSWNLFAMELPPYVQSAGDYGRIPEDFEPGMIGRRSEIHDLVRAVVPDVDFTDPSWGTIDGPGYAIEIGVGHDDEVDSVAFHVHGSSDDVIPIIAAILDRLGVPAVDGSTGDLFTPDKALNNFHQWRAYRDRVIGPD